MAIMSTYSSELVAISSICTYDIYKTYINPKATGKQLMRINYFGMTAFALFMAGFATALYYIGISMGYLYVMMGVVISAAVLPATLTLLWSGQSWAAATFSPILGFVCSMSAWLVTTKVKYGELTVETTGQNVPMLVGNVVSLLAPILFIPILTYLPPFRPQNYDWQSMRDISKVEDEDVVDETTVDLEREPVEHNNTEAGDALEQVKLAKAAKIARWLTVTLTLALLVVWPMPMFGSSYVFSKKVSSNKIKHFRKLYPGLSLTGVLVFHWLGCGWNRMALRQLRDGHSPSLVRVALYHHPYNKVDVPRLSWTCWRERVFVYRREGRD
jgi:hypothetical protein